MEMVRLGIGFMVLEILKKKQKYLQNVSTLKSIISQIRTIEKGESVGYSSKIYCKKKN